MTGCGVLAVALAVGGTAVGAMAVGAMAVGVTGRLEGLPVVWEAGAVWW